MSRKGIYKYLLDLHSDFKELVEFSLSSAIVKTAVTNKTLVKTNIVTITFCYDWKHRNKNFWSKNANMIFGFCKLHYLDQKFDHYPKYQIYTLSPLQYFLRWILYQPMYEQIEKFFSKPKN